MYDCGIYAGVILGCSPLGVAPQIEGLIEC